MSPIIRINGEIIADIPDESGLHQTATGNPLVVDLSGIEARNKRQIVVLESPDIGGRRVVGLTQEGRGRSDMMKKGGDGREPAIEVVLHDRPIRVSYLDKRWVEPKTHWGIWGLRHNGFWERSKRTFPNPRWMRGREGR